MRQNTIFLVLVCIAILHLVSVLPMGQAGSTTYYVSTEGDNDNPGTLDDPWAEPGFASKRLNAGDTMIILAGRYILSEFYEDMITPLNSGADGAWITIKGEEGATPVLAGRDNLFSAVWLDGVSYIRIENLEITSDNGAFFRDGINADEDEISHIVFRNLHIHHIDEFGIDLKDVDELVIDECNINYCGFGAIGGPAGESGGWRNVMIQKCNLSYGGHYYQGGDGSNRPYDRPDGFGIEPSPGPIEIRDCVAEHNRGDGLDSKSENTYIHNCIVANNSCDGIKLWNDNSKVHNCLIYGTSDGVPGATPWAAMVINSEIHNAYFEIINTTIHSSPQVQNYPMYVQYDYPSIPITLVMRNSIVANGYGAVFIGDSVNFAADHNIFYRPGDNVQVLANEREYTVQQIEAGELGQDNLSRDPLFVAPAWGDTGDYHLQQASPGVNAGTRGDGIPDFDLEYVPRPQEGEYDIGAYEYTPDGSQDNIPPNAVSDLTAGMTEDGSSIVLEWTAPGDDGSTGTASAYMVRFNTVPITESNWEESSDVDNEPTPKPAGSAESMIIDMPYPGVIYYFAIKAQDEVPNISSISNSPCSRAPVKLYAGWNLVAFMPSEAMWVSDAVSTMNGNLASIWTFNALTSSWLRYIVGGPEFLNNLELILPGWAYWIFATEDCTWGYGEIMHTAPSNPIMQKPPFMLYGKIPKMNYGATSKISLKSGAVEAASYILGSNPRYQDYYVLEIPLDSTFREGNWAWIYLDDELLPTDQVILGGIGTIRRHDILYTRRPGYTELFQNYPNPFNPETWIPFQLEKDMSVVIKIYTENGRLVRVLDLGHKPAGFYISRERAAYWNGRNEAGEYATSGVYLYTIEAGDYSDTRKMVMAE